MEWSGMKLNEVEWSGMKWNEMEWSKEKVISFTEKNYFLGDFGLGEFAWVKFSFEVLMLLESKFKRSLFRDFMFSNSDWFM